MTTVPGPGLAYPTNWEAASYCNSGCAVWKTNAVR